MFTCSLSSLLDPPACQVGEQKVLPHALEELFPTNLRIACARGHKEEASLPSSEGRKGGQHLLPWDSPPRMRAAAVVWWKIEVNKLIGIEIHRILTKFMIDSWNGTSFFGAQWCCCQRLGLLAKPLKCWTLASLDGKNENTVKAVLAYPAMLLLKPLKVVFLHSCSISR